MLKLCKFSNYTCLICIRSLAILVSIAQKSLYEHEDGPDESKEEDKDDVNIISRNPVKVVLGSYQVQITEACRILNHILNELIPASFLKFK